LEAACWGAVERDLRCGETTVTPNCDVVAAVESQEVIPVYHCLAKTDCGMAPSLCYPPGLGLGDELCAVVDQVCEVWACDAEWQNLINDASGWWRTDTLEAARACTGESGCADVRSCLGAWSDAVFAGSTLADVYPWTSMP
jgi:hypothetical protein